FGGSFFGGSFFGGSFFGGSFFGGSFFGGSFSLAAIRSLRLWGFDFRLTSGLIIGISGVLGSAGWDCVCESASGFTSPALSDAGSSGMEDCPEVWILAGPGANVTKSTVTTLGLGAEN
ncbi:MAG: hypothetical protein ACQETR_03980, partial [Thermodesulfobacteriota bacterium]